MRVRVLGSVEVWSATARRWTSPPPQQRLALALFVTHLGEPCRSDVLQEALWGDDPPARPRRLLQGLVSRLRRALEAEDGADDVLVTVPGGWRLALGREEVDATRFDDLAADAQEQADTGRTDSAAALLREGLALWGGPPFGDLADHPMFAAERARLEERRLTARELSLQLRLQAGEVSDALAELSELVAAHPFRERLHELWMLALYRAGRPADALVAYQQVRERLASELGAEPGPDLQAMHTAILRHDVDGGVGSGGPAAASRERPRTVVSWACHRDLPFVGRDAELAELDAALSRARDGARQLVLVTGEPGIGKTRLVAEVTDRALDDGVRVLVGRCSQGVGVPYQPFVEALRMDLDAATDDDLHGRLARHAGPLARLLPDLAERTGCPPPPPSTNPQLDRHHLFDAVAAWACTAAQQTPFLLVLEDLQWATRETLLLLRQLVRATAAAPLTVVVTYRNVTTEASTELLDTLAELARGPGTTRVELGGLRPQDVGRIVAGHDEHPGAKPARMAGQLYDATAGNPLFVQEMLASTAPGTPDLPRVGDDIELPWSLRQLLDARIHRLAPATVHLLMQAAVAGEQFDFPLVADAIGQDPETALAGLEEAIGARLVVASGDATDRYGFRHAIMRQALLDRPSPSRRARLHAHYAASLEQAHADRPGPVLSELAHHLLAAGPAADRTRTRQVVRAAADTAMAQLAYDEAAALYQRALALLDDDRREDNEARQERCDLLTALGDAQQRAGPGEHSRTLLRALDLATGLADTDRIVEAAWANNRGYPSHLFSIDEERVAALERALEVVGADEPGARATLLALLGGELTFSGPGAGTDQRARRLSDEALALARSGDDTVLARVLMLRQFTIQGPDTLAERLRNTVELVRIADELDDPTLRMFSRQWRAVAAMEAAHRAEADRCIDEALRLADELGEPFMGCTAHMLAANREVSWGDLDAVPALATRAEDLGMQVDAVDIQGVTTLQLLWCHRERGDVEQILPRIEKLRARYGQLPHWQSLLALAWWEVGGHDDALAVLEGFCADGFDDVAGDVAGLHALCCFAEVAAGLDHVTAARQLLPLLEPYADQLDADQALCTGPVAYYLGLLGATLGRLDRADDWLAQASRISEEVDAARWIRRIRLARARLVNARPAPGDAEQARHLVAARGRSAGGPVRRAGSPGRRSRG